MDAKPRLCDNRHQRRSSKIERKKTVYIETWHIHFVSVPEWNIRVWINYVFVDWNTEAHPLNGAKKNGSERAAVNFKRQNNTWSDLFEQLSVYLNMSLCHGNAKIHIAISMKRRRKNQYTNTFFFLSCMCAFYLYFQWSIHSRIYYAARQAFWFGPNRNHSRS